MKTILHILTRPEDPLADSLMATQAAMPDTKVEAVRMTPGSGPENYRELVSKVFVADSVQVW